MVERSEDTVWQIGCDDPRVLADGPLENVRAVEMGKIEFHQDAHGCATGTFCSQPVPAPVVRWKLGLAPVRAMVLEKTSVPSRRVESDDGETHLVLHYFRGCIPSWARAFVSETNLKRAGFTYLRGYYKRMDGDPVECRSMQDRDCDVDEVDERLDVMQFRMDVAVMDEVDNEGAESIYESMYRNCKATELQHLASTT